MASPSLTSEPMPAAFSGFSSVLRMARSFAASRARRLAAPAGTPSRATAMLAQLSTPWALVSTSPAVLTKKPTPGVSALSFCSGAAGMSAKGAPRMVLANEPDIRVAARSIWRSDAA